MVSYFVNCEFVLSFQRLVWNENVLLVGVGLHVKTGVNMWRIPFGLQFIPAGIMTIGLLSVKVSSVGLNPTTAALILALCTGITTLACLSRTNG